MRRTITLLVTLVLVLVASPAHATEGDWLPGFEYRTSIGTEGGWLDSRCDDAGRLFKVRLYEHRDYEGKVLITCRNLPDLCDVPRDNQAPGPCMGEFSGNSWHNIASSIRVDYVRETTGGGEGCVRTYDARFYGQPDHLDWSKMRWHEGTGSSILATSGPIYGRPGGWNDAFSSMAYTAC